MAAVTVSPDVFIGRIGSLTQDQLKPHLDQFGVTALRVLPEKKCAFATFSSFAGAEQAIQALNGQQVETRTIHLKFADVRGGGGEPQPKVFIGGLSNDVTGDSVRELCESFGQVTYTKVFRRREEGPPVGFVTFSSFAEAERCISELTGRSSPPAAEGKTLNLSFADCKKDGVDGKAAGKGTGKGGGKGAENLLQNLVGVLGGNQAGTQALAALLSVLNGGNIAANSVGAVEVPPPGATVDPKFAHLGNQTLTGTVRSWRGEWGFLNSNQFEGDLFAHKKHVLNVLMNLAPGTPVSFQIGLDRLGRTTAMNIKPSGTGYKP